MFVGMDVHRNRIQVCVLDRKGNEVRNRNVANDRHALRRELAGLRRGTPVVCEAAHGTGWIAELLGDPVHQQCLDYALADDDLDGWWAGTSGRERRWLRAQAS